MIAWVGSETDVYRFAVEQAERDVRLVILLASDPPAPRPPTFRVEPDDLGTVLDVRAGLSPGCFEVTVGVSDPPVDAAEDELTLTVQSDRADVPACRLVVRRTRCRVSAGLVQRDAASAALRPETRAALLWHAWGRYSELVGLRRFTAGTSDSDVMVYRPRLRNPATRDPALVGAEPLDVMSQAWGAYLLVKTGAVGDIRDEWERFRLFLADQLHPFMARIEACLVVRGPGRVNPGDLQATLVGAFVGGDLLQAESLESVLRGPADADALEDIARRVFQVAGPWYASGAPARLGNWWKMLRSARAAPAASPVGPGAAGLTLFGRYDLAGEEDRRRLGERLVWDGEFCSREHLAGHLLGHDGSGLLYQVAELPVRHSLVHGDLHVRNVLVAPDQVSLLDFGGTGIAPTLFDFARLEVFVRLWGLDLGRPDAGLDPHATRLETLLLDHFTATEGGLQPVHAIAPSLGVRADDLLKIARFLTAIRREALPYCLDTPDRRDYLAVLYLTVFHALRFAGRGPEPAGNFRWLMALFWVLEDALSRIVGLTPFRRRRLPPEPERLLDAAWLAGPGAPGRVRYWLERPEGRAALLPVAATCGVLQGSAHPLDLFDETMLTVGYLEGILADPTQALLDPVALDARVQDALTSQGIVLPTRPDRSASARTGRPGQGWTRRHVEELRQPLEATLDDRARLVLKWVALFQNAGKPATRVIVPDPGSGRGTVQFPGHEIYGLQLVAEPLRQLFPEETERSAVARLLAAHPRHVALLRACAEAPWLLTLERALAAGIACPEVLAEALGLAGREGDSLGTLVPLWLLHGYAAALAGRSADSPSAETTAAIGTSLLVLYFRAHGAGPWAGASRREMD
jgi:hypothetical protein